MGFSPVTTYAQTPTIQAEGAILIDAKTGKILFEKNAHTPYYPASITKLMTTLLTIEALKPTQTITISEDAIHSIDAQSSSIGMRVGEQITVDQALRALLLMSDNHIANALAEAISSSTDAFAAQMTQKAQALGTTHTHFTNPHGLHDENHYTTAYDMALIVSALYDNPYFLEIMSEPVFEIPPTNKSSVARPLSQEHGLMNERRNSVLYRSDVIGGKTGFTNEARHTLVTVARQGDIDLIAVILKSEKSTLYDDTNALLDYGFNAYQTIDLHDTSSVLTSLPVYTIKSGELFEAAQADIAVFSDQSLLINKSIALTDISTNLHLPEYLDLGIQESGTVGTIDYIYDNEIIASNDLVIQNLTYQPAPFEASDPKETAFSLSVGMVIACFGTLFLVVGLFSQLRYRYKRRRYRHQKIHLSRKLK